MYKVLRYFTDLQDNGFAYNAGDTFPRDGKAVSQGRLDELAGSENKQGRPLIEFVEDEPKDSFAQYMNPPEESAADEQPKKYDYTKNDVNRMSKANLKRLGEELGIEGAADMTGGALKPLIIKRLGL